MKKNKDNLTILMKENQVNEVENNRLKNITQNHPPGQSENPLAKMLKEHGGINGMGHSLNCAHNYPYIYNNFPHRCEDEVVMHRALYEMNQRIAKEKGPEYTFFYMPLPVSECLNKKRVELDFFVVINSYCFAIEVDGPSHAEKSHFIEEERLRFIKQNGIEVFRIRPNENNPNWAHDELVSIFKIIKRKRGLL